MNRNIWLFEDVHQDFTAKLELKMKIKRTNVVTTVSKYLDASRMSFPSLYEYLVKEIYAYVYASPTQPQKDQMYLKAHSKNVLPINREKFLIHFKSVTNLLFILYRFWLFYVKHCNSFHFQERPEGQSKAMLRPYYLHHHPSSWFPNSKLCFVKRTAIKSIGPFLIYQG